MASAIVHTKKGILIMEFPIKKRITVTDESGNELSFNVRPYLLNSDIEIIESQIENIRTRQGRKNIVDILLMRFCTDIEDFDSDELDVSILDLYRINGVIERVYDCLDDDSQSSIRDLIDINVGDEIRTIKLLVADLMTSVNNIEDGTAQNALKDAVKTLEDAKARQDKLLGKKG